MLSLNPFVQRNANSLNIFFDDLSHDFVDLTGGSLLTDEMANDENLPQQQQQQLEVDDSESYSEQLGGTSSSSLVDVLGLESLERIHNQIGLNLFKIGQQIEALQESVVQYLDYDPQEELLEVLSHMGSIQTQKSKKEKL